MIQFKRTISCLLILLVGVSAIVPDSAEEILTKAVQSATGQWAGPDLDDLTDELVALLQTNLLPDTPELQTHTGTVFSHTLSSETPRLHSLRL